MSTETTPPWPVLSMVERRVLGVLAEKQKTTPDAYPMTLNGLVKSMRPLTFNVGREFEVVTVSFDPNEKPELAAAKKNVYVKDYGRAGAASGWHFLTGSADSIERLTQAAGYRYKWDEYSKQWAHVSAIMSKLGARSRTQAASIAAARGLLSDARDQLHLLPIVGRAQSSQLRMT